MGNKMTRRKSTGSPVGEPGRKRKKGKKGAKQDADDGRDRILSCPELGGGVPYPQNEDKMRVNVKMYRSYRDLDMSKFGSIRDEPDIKVYRRSTSSLPSKSATLPRNYGRSKSAGVPNGNAGTMPPDFVRSRDSTDGGGDARSSKRASITSSGSTIAGKKVIITDFPTTAEIKQKLSCFEENFARILTSKYGSLPDTLQLSALVLAMGYGERQQPVSLLDYLDGNNVPIDLLNAVDNYILVIPPALFHGIAHVRRDKMTDVRLWTSLAADIVMCVAMEAASELARMYEYQIALLIDDASIRILASHAADCVIDYITRANTMLDRNTTILGVMRGRSPQSTQGPNLLAAAVGDKELKWNLNSIFTQPGLRKEMSLYWDELNTDGVEQSIWHFHSSGKDDTVLYGYRGELLEWDFVQRLYKLNPEEQARYNEESEYRPDDYNRWYVPYRRLVGAELMQNYCHLSASEKTTKTLAEFLMQPEDVACGRNELEPIYRPLSPGGKALQFQNVNLDHVDLTRAQLGQSNVSRASFRNAKLALADMQNTNMEKAELSGSDISYTNVGLSPEQIRDVKAQHVVLTDGHTPNGGVSPSPDSPNVSLVSDRSGQVIPVQQVIEQHQKRIEEQPPPEPVIAAQTAGTTASKPRKGSKGKRTKKKPRSLSNTSDGSEPSLRNVSGGSQPQLRSAQTPTENGPSQRHVVSSGNVKSPGPLTTTGFPPDRSRSATASPIEPSYQPPSQAEPWSPGKALSAADVNTDRVSRPGPHGRGRRSLPKSVSHHGRLTGAGKYVSTDSYGLFSSRRQLSQAEIEFLRRSQIFNMIKGLQIPNMADNLPRVDPQFINRTADVEEVADLVSSAGRVVAIVGCHGIGKSAFAIAVGNEMKRKQVVPFLIDARGCTSTAGLQHRLMRTFGLRFRTNEMDYFYRWINSHEQLMLFIFDNMEFPESEDEKLSDFIDNLMIDVKNIRVICTTPRHFFRGQTNSEIYRLGDVRQHSADLLRKVIPDLHDDGLAQLSDACDNVPYALNVAAKSCILPDVDSGRLVEDLVSHSNGVFPPAKLEELVYTISQDETNFDRLAKILCALKKIYNNLPATYSSVLTALSPCASYVDKDAVTYLVDESDKETLDSTLKALKEIGLLVTDSSMENVLVPTLVKQMIKASTSDLGDALQKYINYFLNKLKSISIDYHSQKFMEATADLDRAYDNFQDVIQAVLNREDTYKQCSEFASLEYAIFLRQAIAGELYVEFYENLALQSDEMEDKGLQLDSMCCLSYYYVMEQNFEKAKQQAERAYEAIMADSETKEAQKAFCLHCLGNIYWHDEDDKEKGVFLLKRALDINKLHLGLRHLRTLYSNEDYGFMLTKKERFQSARHYYNVSDFVVREVLNDHPLLLNGYDCRRVIWDKLGLFARAMDTAKRAASVATLYYGDHPKAALYQSRLCESIMKRGSLQDAISAGVTALAIRIKVLGDHIDTGLSYKTLAYLMLRSGQYDEAVRFAQCALDIYDKLDAKERFKIDAKNLVAQARYRLEYKSSIFVELESKDASRPVVKGDDLNVSGISSISTEV